MSVIFTIVFLSHNEQLINPKNFLYKDKIKLKIIKILNGVSTKL